MLDSLGESIDEERRAKSLQRLLEREERQMEEWIEQMERSGRDWQMKLEMKEEGREEEEKKLKALEEEMAAIVRAEEAEAAALTETEEQAIVDTCIDTDERARARQSQLQVKPASFKECCWTSIATSIVRPTVAPASFGRRTLGRRTPSCL